MVGVAMGSSSTIWRRKQVKQASRGGIQLAKHLRVTDLVSIGSPASSALLFFKLGVLVAFVEHNAPACIDRTRIKDRACSHFREISCLRRTYISGVD